MNFMVKFPLLKLLKTPFGTPLKKHISTGHYCCNKLCIEQLKERGLLCIHGPEASTFLQGLITNDMKHLEGAQSMYCMFLNIRGRVLCDSLLYKESENTFLIESDKDVLSTLQKHLKMYRVRRKIDIDFDSSFNIWVMFHESGINTLKDAVLHSLPKEENKENIQPVRSSAEFESIKEKSIIVCRDPRLSELGYRIIAPVEENFVFPQQERDSSNLETYKILRYKLGVGEGIAEIPPGKSFPLELNCDFLHGVSFHKGCYIGQELTARVYHTGVIRKRLMPIFLERIPSESFKMDAVIENGMTKTSVGKLRGLENLFGLGLLKIDEAIRSPALNVLNVHGNTFKPCWWPHEAPKERSVAGRE